MFTQSTLCVMSTLRGATINQVIPEVAQLFLATLQASESTQPISIFFVAVRLRALSDCEREVLHFMANGLTTNQIAEQLFISPNTVNDQRAQISQKLGLRGYFSLLQFAQRYHHCL